MEDHKAENGGKRLSSTSAVAVADLGYGRCVGTARHYPRVREVFGAKTQREREKREV